MKQVLCLLCMIALCICLFGCNNASNEFKEPVDVFFCASTVVYNSKNGVFAREVRDFSGWNENIHGFLNEYITSSTNGKCTSPFPVGAWILRYEQKDTTANLVLNVHFSKLAPNELTLACACISMTLFGLTDVETVNLKIDGSYSRTTLTMTRTNLCLTNATQIG